LAAAVVPARPRRPVVEWLARHCNWIGLAAGAIVPLTLAWLGGGINRHHVAEQARVLLTLGASLYAILAGPFSLGAAPPLRDLPRGDPALRRLVQGIARRVRALRDRAAALPAAQQMILGDLLQEAATTEALATRLAENAQPAAPVSAEAETLPQGTSRDRLAGRLLEIAAALDDALAVADQAEPDSQSASGALQRLRDEIDFARRALPEIAAADPPPPPVAARTR
jgi:hypothetical protein